MSSVLIPSLQELPGGMVSTWDVAAKNKSKNRYGNIVTCKFVYFFFCCCLSTPSLCWLYFMFEYPCPQKKKSGATLHSGLKVVWTNETCGITFSTYINFLSLMTLSYCSWLKGITHTIKDDHDFCMRTQISNIPSITSTIFTFIIRI